MSRSNAMSGASAGVLMLAFFSTDVLAQESLPTIDIGAESSGRARVAPAGRGRQGGDASERGGPEDPTAYHVPNAVSATKTDTPIMEMPINVQIVPRQVLQDQQAVVIEQAVKNVSNVFPVPYVGLQGGWNIRGFLDWAYYQDGVRVNPWAALPPRDTVDVQQVEIVKGPASILYGRMQPGGLVEVTTKKPQAEPHYEVQQIFGSYSSYRTLLSATGPVTPDKSLLYRVDLAYQNENSFRDGLYNSHIYFAPKLYWEPTQDTSLTAYLTLYSGRDPIDAGIPGIYSPNVPKSWNSVAAVPRSRNYGSVDAALRSNYDLRFGYNFSHAFDSDWKLVHRLDVNLRDVPERWLDVYNPDPGACTIASCPIARDFGHFSPGHEQNYFTSLELTGHFDTFGVRHTLLVGADGYHTNDDYLSPFNWTLVPATDLFHPAYPGSLLQYTTVPDSISRSLVQESWLGVYVQDQMKLPYDFHLLAGFRYDSARTNSSYPTLYPTYTPDHSAESADAVKPRVGLLWQPIPQLGLYGNYIEGFGVSNGVNASRRPLPPEEARQWEGGVKVDLFDSRLTATASWFHIVKTNVRSPVPGGGSVMGISETTGAVRNTGFEFDVQGQVTPEIKIIGSYSNIDSKIISDIRGGKVGNHWWGVPRNAGSLWAVYEPQAQPLKGLAVGAGFVARGSVEVDKNNSFTLPGYTVVDLMGRYSFDYEKSKVTFQLNVSNLLDQTYYLPSFGPNGLPGAPRIFKGSIKVEY